MGCGASVLTVRASSGCRCISSAWLGMSPLCRRSVCCRDALLFRSFRLRRASKLIPLISSCAVCEAMSTSQSGGVAGGDGEGGGEGARGTSASCLDGSSLAR